MTHVVPNPDWANFLELFELPRHRNTYLLGSFARYVTMYSQQVRALNLIAALIDTGQIGKDANVAVVGAGAAGLTAAAAFHYAGARVTLVERLGQLMALQRNNRQRWLHPHIYDWPNQSLDSNRAGLPILDWQAGYAEAVARQIASGWERITANAGDRMQIHRHAGIVGVPANTRTPTLRWKGADHKFDVAILAVGFGLEARNEHQWSYWEEDAIDAGLRVRKGPQRWLIHGVGDSALTDLMRLCIDRFRHEELPELFRGRREFESIRLDLLAIQDDQRCATDAAALTEQFERLETNGLEDTLRGRLRKDVSVFLCTPTDYQYDPRAATINRLMLRLLSKLGAYQHISVPCEQRGKQLALSRDDSGERYLPAAASERPFDAEVLWRVAWLDEVFDRVLIRGGPKWAVKESFPRIWKATKKLQETWEELRLGDATRRLRWAPDRFEPESPRPSERFMEAATPYGVCAQGVKVVKEISSDGSAVVIIHVRGLTNLSPQPLKGVRLKFTSAVGIMGQPELDAQGQQLGTWKPDPDSPPVPAAAFGDRLETERRRLVSVSGLFTFAKPLLKGKPVSFGLRIYQLNTDALSRWDFDAMYGKGEKNIDGAPLVVETFYRHVWFPVETLTVSITLPHENPTVDWRGFGSSARGRLSTIAKNRPTRRSRSLLPIQNGILSWRPPEPVENKPWKAFDKSTAVNVTWRPNGRTSTLVVSRPEIGTCYSIEWQPLEATPSLPAQTLERSARQIRLALLRYGRSGNRSRAKSAINERFVKFAKALWDAYRDPRPEERFEVTLLTYDAGDRRLHVVDSWRSVQDNTSNALEFTLPFGVGLAGACFKRADRVFLHVHKPESGPVERTKGSPGPPDYFIEIPGHPAPGVILAVPLDHPDYDTSFDAKRRSQQCIGVIDITSNLPDAALLTVVPAATTARKLRGVIPALCQAFTRDLKELLHVGN